MLQITTVGGDNVRSNLHAAAYSYMAPIVVEEQSRYSNENP